jgi:hypothetical protein
MSSGVTQYARTLSSLVVSNLTRNRLHSPGKVLIAVAANASTIDFQSSIVLGRNVEAGLRGAPTIVCISGLTVVGPGTLRAGISNPSETAAMASVGERSLSGVMLKKTSFCRRNPGVTATRSHQPMMSQRN